MRGIDSHINRAGQENSNDSKTFRTDTDVGDGWAGSKTLKWVLGLILFLLALAAVATSALIVERQAALQRVSRYNLTWLLSQAVSETLRFAEAISAAAVPGSSVDRDDVELRADVLESRMNLLGAGEAAAFIETRPDLKESVRVRPVGSFRITKPSQHHAGDVPISVEIGRSSAAGLDVMLRRSAVQELV